MRTHLLPVLVFFGLLFITLPTHAQQQGVFNVQFRQEAKTILIFYDLMSPYAADCYTVEVYFSPNGGRTYRPLTFVSGAVGPNQTPGFTKQITWQAVEEEGEFANSSARFKVRATQTTSGDPVSQFTSYTDPWAGAMVAVRGGAFQMGSNEGRSNEKPVHSVTVGDFYLSKYEVTNAQYAAFLNAKGNQTEGGATWYDASGSGYKGYAEAAIVQQGGRWTVKTGRENHPVNYVSWYGAAAYCTWLSEKTGHRYRLPTEAEWEYAAGGGSSNRTKYAGTNDALDTYAWYKSNTNDTGTRPVGGKRPNGLGLYDMSGNVWEWCADWYGYYASSPSNNPKGPSSGAYRVNRGGSWNDDVATYCRVVNRGFSHPDFRNYLIGFRPSRTP